MKSLEPVSWTTRRLLVCSIVRIFNKLRGVIWGGLGAVAPPKKKKKKKKKRKKRKKERKERKNGTINNVKLLQIKFFFQIFNSPVALEKKLAPQEKVEMTPLNKLHKK